MRGKPSFSDTILAMYCALFDRPVKACVEDFSAAELDELQQLACSRGKKPSDTVRSVIDEYKRKIAAQADALRICAETFREYEALHRAKGTPDGEAKAQRNAEKAKLCEDLLKGEQHGG